MDYNKYFEKLLLKQNELEKNFPYKKTFKYNKGKYHTQALQYENVKYNFVISSERSSTYGKDFTGLIVEVYIDNTNYFDSYFLQLKEQKELIESELFEKDIIWQAKGESAKGTVCRIFAKKEVDIEDETKWDEYINWQMNTMIDFLKVIPKYTKKLKKEFQNMNKEYFIKWLREDNRSASMISNYPLYLEKYIPDILITNSICDYNNIFLIDSKERITDILNLFDTNTNLKEFNKIKSSFPISSLNKYLQFLIYKDSKNIKIKNIMLYGAPGVGKTYNYKNLITMIEKGDKDIKEIFRVIENEEDIPIDNDIYQSIKNDKRIEFVTFHQSYSYEDFIEGFRPSEDEDRIVRKDGIFKIIADKSRKNLENSKKDIIELEKENKAQTLFNSFVQNLIDKEDYSLSKSVDISDIDSDAFYYTSKTGGIKNSKILFIDLIEMINNQILNQTNIKTLENISGTTKRRPTYLYAIYKKFLEYIKENHPIEDSKTINKEESKNFYIVIDEINRGNISKIFGELITLIEEDKRDKYSVTLPYSKKDFSVPSNLYIIATMNSTDKSIATIDIALRRRFTFLKMKPKESLVKDFVAKNLMNKLNIYIKDTLGEDYKLGHSYFMGENIDLEFIVDYKIKPLLEEYYYSDEDKLKEVFNLLKEEN